MLSADPRQFLTPHFQETKQTKNLALGKRMALEVKEEQHFKNTQLQTTLILLLMKKHF